AAPVSEAPQATATNRPAAATEGGESARSGTSKATTGGASTAATAASPGWPPPQAASASADATAPARRRMQAQSRDMGIPSEAEPHGELRAARLADGGGPPEGRQRVVRIGPRAEVRVEHRLVDGIGEVEHLDDCLELRAVAQRERAAHPHVHVEEAVADAG